MPVQSTIDKKLSLVIGFAWGSVTFVEIMAHQDKLLADPDFNPEFSQLMDCSEISDWCVSLDEAETAARRTLFSQSSKRAFVVPRPPASPPLTRILEAFFNLSKHESRIQVFQDVPSALDWLGLEGMPASELLRGTSG